MTRAVQKHRHVTIGLLWHSLSSGNLGVGALTESNISIIRSISERMGFRVRFIVLGTTEQGCDALANELCEAGHDLETHQMRVYRSSYRKLLRQCDLILDIGEGDSFTDLYGFKRFYYLWLSKNIACLLRRPLILAPQTIGPFNGRIARRFAIQVMNKLQHIFTRDNLSIAYIERFGTACVKEEATDVAFRLPFVRKQFADDGIVRVGINVSGLLFNGGYSGNNQFGLKFDYRSAVRELLSKFSSFLNVEIHLVSHVIIPEMPIEDDFAVAKQLAGEFPHVIVAPRFVRPGEAKSYISGLDFFCGARMHACIAAFSAGVPVVPMAYSRKFGGLFGALGYSHVADCTLDSQDAVVNRIIDAFEARAALREEVARSLNLANQRLAAYEDCLSFTMKKVLGL